MRSSILAAIAALSVAPSAHAEQWWFVRVGEDSGLVIELDSIASASSGTRRVWTANVYATPVKNVVYQDVSLSRILFELDCKDGRFRSLQSSFMTKEFVSRYEHTSTSLQWQYAPPGTAGSAILEVACKGSDKADLVGPLKDLSEAVDLYFTWLHSQKAASK